MAVRIAGRAALIIVGALGATALSAGAASAAQCVGNDSITGIGSSQQASAQRAWGAAVLPFGPDTTGFGYLDVYDPTANPTGHGCAQFAIGVPGGKTVTYDPQGSRDGLKAVGASTIVGEAGVRNTNYAFAATDLPPTVPELAEANNGPDHLSGTSDDAVLHTIPVAQAAVAIDVKLPAGCTLAASSTARRISRTALEGVFAGRTGYTTWGAVLPAISGAGCATKPITRVVRPDAAGTTAALKNYLRSITPNGAADFPTSQSNTAWPNNSGSTATVSATANGDGPQLDTLASLFTNGGIGYADLATSREKAYDWATGGGAGADDRFWLYVERSGGTYGSPAVSNNAGAIGASRGTLCQNVTYQTGVGGPLPSTTTGSWATVNAVSPPSDYAICALDYALAWERPSHANVGSLQPPITIGQAQTVKDFLGFVTEFKTAIGGSLRAGQSQLVAAGYRPLPNAIRTTSVTGVNALDW